MRNRGRPPRPADQQAVALRLERRHVEILDEIIRERIKEELKAGEMVVQNRAAADGQVYVLERQVNLPAERRRLFGEIVELYQRLHSALTVKIVAPCESDAPERKREADAWIATLEARLTDEAPVGVQVALAKRVLRRMNEPDRNVLQGVLRAARLARAGSTDDGETS